MTWSGASTGEHFLASNPPTGVYGTKTNAIVRPMGLNLSTYAGYDSSGATFSDTALAAIAADLPSGGGRIYQPLGSPKFQNTLTLPASFALDVLGDGRLASRWNYQGAVQQPFLVFPGLNQGVTFKGMALGGFWADPVIQILSSTGTGVNGYNSEITFDDCVVGYLPTAGFSVPGTSLALRGLQVQCDVFRATNSSIGGRSVGVQFDGGTSDWWLINCDTTVLPQGAEALQYGIFCQTGANPFTGSGHLINSLISGAGSSTTAAVLRSVVDVISTHCESAHLPFSLQAGKFQIIGGTFNGDATCTVIFLANAASGRFAPANVSKTAALTTFFQAGSSNGSWLIEMPDAAAVPGGLPATPIICDWIGPGSKFPGYPINPTGYSAFAAPAMLTAQTGAVGSLASFFVPSDAKHFYRISMQVTITTHGTESINAQVTYTDSGGTARTMTIPLTNTAGTTATAAAAADSFTGVVTIACNANTTITLKTAGTFTGGVVYNVGGQAELIN